LAITFAEEPLRSVTTFPDDTEMIFHWLVATWMIRQCWFDPLLSYHWMI
jgi:hypothetical protein